MNRRGFLGVALPAALVAVPLLTPLSAAALPTSSTFSWQGYTWTKRSHAGAPMYNGAWSPANVEVSSGALRLKVTNPTRRSPIGAEVRSTRTGWGYGTYTAVVETNFDTMGKSIVFGNMFTYDFTQGAGDSANEIDLGEISAWGVPGEQPALTSSYKLDGGPGNVVGYNVPLPAGLRVTTHRMVWGPDRISFRSYRGRGTAGPVIATRTLTRASVPVPGNERVIFNLWVTSANADNQHATKTFQAVVTGFTFKPRPS